MRRDPRVSITVMDGPDWYRQLTIFGRVTRSATTPSSRTSTGCLRYTRRSFSNRLRARISALILPERWYGWEGSGYWPS